MEEPSVLDFVLDKLTFWKESKLSIPPLEADPQLADPKPVPVESKGRIWKSISPLIPLLFAIIAQIFGEPDNRSPQLIIFFYCAAAVSLILLVLFRNWNIEPLIRDQDEAGEFTIRWVQFLTGMVISGLAFFFFGGNLFNGINLTLWLTGFALIWWSLWIPENWWKKFRIGWEGFWQRGIRITPWMVLVAAVFLISVFYRFYLLNQVPPEMFSDHAEKLIDVTDVLNGKYFIFFPRNSGREAVQMYLTAVVARVFGTGISFLSLKLGTCLAGLFSLPFIYLLGVEIKNKQVGLLAMFFAGIAYWPNVISRVALRFVFYPAFVAPTLYFLIKGLKRKRWNDFLFAGIFLGLGLHGYSPFRIVPLVVILILLIYFTHTKSEKNRKMAIISLVLVGLISLIIFLPLGRYAISNYDSFAFRMLTRLSNTETAYPGPPLNIFFSNLWKSLIMFQWDNGQTWVHSIPGRPALGLISAALFSLGVILLIVRYIKHRHWLDLVLLLSIPFLMLPSILSLAFPAENPSLNRTSGAIIPVFLVVALAVENIMINIKTSLPDRWGTWFSYGVVILVAISSMNINAHLVFEEYYYQFKIRAWNSSEIGGVIRQFSNLVGDEYHAWVVPYPHWVDTRLVGIQAIDRVKDYALWPPEIYTTENTPAPKLYIYKPDDEEAIRVLQELYPDGITDRFQSEVEGRDFMLYYVLP